MAEERIVRTIEIKTKGAEKSLGDVDKAQKNVTKSTSKLDDSLGKLPGPLGAARAGVQSLSKAFKALMANPIVLLIAAIVAALAGLFKAFTKTQAGADKMGDAMTALGAIIEVLVERAAKLFMALGKIVRGDIKGGFDEIKGAVKGVGDEMNEAARAAIELERATRRLYEAETEVIVANSERRQQIAELVFLTRDQTKSIEERRQAILDADKIEKEILQDNIRLQEQRLANVRQEIENTPELQRTREQFRKIAEEEAKLIDLQTNSLAKQRELKNRLNELDNKAAMEAAARAKEQAELSKAEEERLAAEAEERAEKQAEMAAAEQERLDAIAEAERKRTESLEAYKRAEREKTHQGRLENLRNELESGAILQEEYNLRLEDLEEKHQEDLKKIKEQSRQEQLAADQKAQAERDRLAAEQVENEMMLRDVKAQIYNDSLDALIGFLGEGSKAAKAVAIADATRSAIAGAINAFTSVVKLPAPVGPILAPIAAGAALAAGMANVRKIAQTDTPIRGGGGGGGSAPSINLSQPDTNVDDIVQTDVGIGTDVNIVQDRTSRGNVKAYVVESEVTAEQDMARQRERESSL